MLSSSEISVKYREINPIGKYLRDVAYLLWSQIIEMRTGWVWYLLMLSFIPCTTLFFFGFFVKSGQEEMALFIVTGNVIFSLVLGTLNMLGQQLGWMKERQAFDHYATLPISKTALIVAMVTRGTLFSFPAMLTLFVVGKFLFNLPINPHPLLIPVVLLSGYSLAGVGAVIGFYSPNGQIANIATQVVFPVVVFVAPVMVPPQNLPTILRITSKGFPTTYIASAFRATVAGNIGPDVWTDLGVILGFAVVSLYLVAKKFDWRAR